MRGLLEWILGVSYTDPRAPKRTAEADKIERIYDALESPYGNNKQLYDMTWALLQEAKFPDPTSISKKVMSKFLDRCDEARIPLPHVDIVMQMVYAVAAIYSTEMLNEEPPAPDTFKSEYSGAVRDILISLQRKAIHPTTTLNTFTDCMIDCFLSIARCLPLIATDNDNDNTNELSLPLITLLPNIEQIIQESIAPFYSFQAKDIGLFCRMRKLLDENAVQIDPRRSLPPSEFVSRRLKETSMENIFLKPQIPFSIPEETRFAGHWIIAPPGRGKTTLLHSMVLNDLEKDACVILMDSKGDLIEPFRDLKSIADRLIVIDPDPQSPIALNPLDIDKTNVDFAIDQLEYLFSSLLETKMTTNQQVLFRNVFRLLSTVPNATLETFRDLLQNGYGKYLSYIETLSPRARDFFLQEFDDEKGYKDRRKEVVGRLRALLDYSDTMAAMLTATTTRFKINEAMDTGKVVVINNSKARLGDAGAEFFGRFFIAQVLAAGQQRSGRKESQKKPVYFYIDECQNVVSRDERIPVILDELRSQKIALILAHQRTEQIKSSDVLSALSNCAIRYANSDAEAKYLSTRLRCNVELLQDLPRGRFAAFVRDLTKNAIVLDVERSDLDSMERLSKEELHALKARMAALYGVQPETQREPPKPPPTRPPEPQKPRSEPPPEPPSSSTNEAESEDDDEGHTWGK